MTVVACRLVLHSLFFTFISPPTLQVGALSENLHHAGQTIQDFFH